jgi:hypothetical protein
MQAPSLGLDHDVVAATGAENVASGQLDDHA